MQQTQGVLIVVLLLLLIGTIIWGIREVVIRLMLSRSGVKVIGHITDMPKEGSGRGGPTYYLTYDYHYNGSTYSRKERVSWLIYDYYEKGEDVTVSCLPENPNTARLAWKIPASIVGKVGAVALIFLGVVLIILLALFIIIYFARNTGDVMGTPMLLKTRGGTLFDNHWVISQVKVGLLS